MTDSGGVRPEPRVPRLSGRAVVSCLAVGLAALGAACSSPAEVVDPPSEALVASGDSQYGTRGQTLSTPLQVLVRSIVTRQPREGATVVWSVESGDASFVGPSLTATDSTGSARATVRLGQTVGEVSIRATVQAQNQASTTFRLFVVERPVLSGIAPTSAAPGESITLTGGNFSPDADQNVVLFSGIRGRVTSASATELTVTVPDCLPQRSVVVSAQLGSVASDGRSLAVGAGGEVVDLQPGGVADAVDPDGYDCITVPGHDLPGVGVTRYALLVQSASALGAASYDYTLHGLSGAPAPAAVQAPAAALRRGSTPAVRPEADHAQLVLDRRLRELEKEATRDGGARAWGGDRPRLQGPAGASPARTPPTVGERRTFQVFRAPGDFTEVDAVARFVGERAALFVDEEAPAGGYTSADLASFSQRFDEYIHPAVTGLFGTESDLDGNDRVVILFSPAVNALTARGSTGFVGGFFFGIDLLPEETGSNAGEIFYTLVPDPTGIFSDPREKDALLEVVPAVLAHEFQHMAAFNQRVLLVGAQANEAVWLNEGLAQYAEEAVARAYEADGDAEGAALFRGGVRDRSRRYLSSPETVSLVISAGNGTLAERGGGFLDVLYLVDRFGDGLLEDLTRTSRIGVDNVEAETGTQWPVLLSDWWTAVRLDGTGLESGPTAYPDVDLRSLLGNPYPLEPEELAGGGFVRTGSLPAASVAYFETEPTPGGTITVRIGGEGGGVSPPQARLRLRIVRVQ